MHLERIYTVILGPHVSEKTTLLGEANNQYAFKVAVDATKAEIKQAVEALFDVTVERVTTLNVKGKVKRNQRGTTRRNCIGKGCECRQPTLESASRHLLGRTR